MLNDDMDLTPEHAIDILMDAHFRIVDSKYGGIAEIFFCGEWMRFGRTDLKDDVATSKCNDTMEDLLGRVYKYVEGNLLGVRVRIRPHGKFFEVIDQYSDG